MIKTSLVLLLSGVALAVAGVVRVPVSFPLGPTAAYIDDANYEAPLNCLGSQAATKPPSVGEKMCRSLMNASKSDQTDKDAKQDLLFECACALATHNIWYKNITDSSIKSASRLFDRAIVVKLNDLKPLNYVVATNTFNSRVNYLRSLNNPKWTKEIRTNVGEYLSNQRYLDSQHYFDRSVDLSKRACKSLADNEQWSNFIKPSLNAIEAGLNLKRTLIITQPELDHLVGLENLCNNVIL